MTERIDPQPATDERTTLREFLDWYRATLLLKVDGLTDDQARLAAVPPSDLTLMGLVRHMAEVERGWFRRWLTNEMSAGPIFYSNEPDGDEDGDLHPGPTDTLAAAIAALNAEIAIARANEAACESLDQVSTGSRIQTVSGNNPPPDWKPNLRWIMVHMIEEYARHCGHADLLRQSIDGAVGD